MPLEQCGHNGWRWGSSGACYTGPNAKQKAIKQGLSYEGENKVRQELSKSSIIGIYMLETAIAEWRGEGSKRKKLDEDNDNASFAYISQEERNKVASDDFGWPSERKYPVRNQEDLDNAAHLVGRAPSDEQDHIKARLKEIARRKGLKLPDSWVNE